MRACRLLFAITAQDQVWGRLVSNATPRENERTKNDICLVFKEHGLNITIEVNKKIVDFLGVTLDLNDSTYRPYTKPNNSLLYVNKESNHPPSVVKNIPAGINRRLSSISSDERSFDREEPPYQKVLDESGCNYRLKFDPPRTGHRRTRERNILWFNPPFSKSVSTNIGKKFLALVDRCFPRGHTLNKIFNRNTIKISYSCMSNVKQLIDSHNKRLLAAYSPSLESAKTKLCNCRKKGECLTSGVVYQAKIRRKDNDKFETQQARMVAKR